MWQRSTMSMETKHGPRDKPEVLHDERLECPFYAYVRVDLSEDMRRYFESYASYAELWMIFGELIAFVVGCLRAEKHI